MDLKTNTDSIMGKSLSVNGTEYEVDAKGYLRGATQKDGSKLLAIGGWVKVADSSVKRTPQIPEAKPLTDKEVVDVIQNQDQFVTEAKSTDPEEMAEDPVFAYPEPALSMKKEYLHKMCEDFGLDYPVDATKPELVKLLKEYQSSR